MRVARISDFEIQIFVNISIKINQSFLPKLHRSSSGECFGYRAYVHDAIQAHRYIILISACPYDFDHVIAPSFTIHAAKPGIFFSAINALTEISIESYFDWACTYMTVPICNMIWTRHQHYVSVNCCIHRFNY